MTQWRRFLSANSRIALLSNLSWSGGNHIVRTVVIALVTVLMTRHLGPSTFGALALSLGIVKIAVVVAGLGLERVVVRALVLHPALSQAVIRRSLFLKLGSGLVIYVMTCAWVQMFLPADDHFGLLVAIAGVAIVCQAFDTFDFVFQANGRMKLSFIGRTVPFLVAALLKVGAILFGAKVVTFAILEAVEAVLIGVGLSLIFLWNRKTNEKGGIKNSKVGTLSMLRDSLPLSIAAVAVTVYLRSDVIMLGAMVNSEVAGLYTAAAQISELWGILPVAIAPAIYPALLRIRETDREEYQKRFQLIVQGMIAIAYAVATGVTFLAPAIIKILYGDAFAEAASVLRVHVWSILFVFLGTTQSLWDAGEGMFWFTCIRAVLGSATNIGLNLALIPHYGPVGAAIATLLSYAIAAVVLNAATSRTRPLFRLQVRALLLLNIAAWLMKKRSAQHAEPGIP